MGEQHESLTSEYTSWLSSLKRQIVSARQKFAVSLNARVIELYWQIGSQIVEKERNANWGSGLIDRLSRDLTHEFPDMKGF